MKTIEAEKLAVVDWLKHPSELGAEPYEIEFTKQFTTEDEYECMIFKFKQSFSSPWLIAISSDIGIYSELKEYNPETEVHDATMLIEELLDLWVSKMDEKEERAEREENSGKFLAFALLRNQAWDFASFEKSFEQEWEINIAANKEESVETRVYKVPSLGEKAVFVLSFIPNQIPMEEVAYHAQMNYMWQEAEATVKSHNAQLMISVMGADQSLEGGIFLNKALSVICKDANTLGVYYNDVVLQPQFFLASAEMIKQDMLPLMTLVWIGMARSGKGISAYTSGLHNFGKDEIEILDTDENPKELHDFLLDIAGYVLEEDVILHDGETIGVSNTQRLKITKSAGVNVNGDSLKIEYKH